MGTNFYARIIPTKKRKKELCTLIETSEDFRSIKESIQETYGSVFIEGNILKGGKVHLGKRSAGWKFLWNPNVYEIRNGHIETEEIEPGHSRSHWIEEPSTAFKLYELNRESIKKFINSDDIEIYDEYGEKQDKEDFWEMALDWITWTDHKTGKLKEAWDGKSYEIYERENNPNHRSFDYKTEYCNFLISQGYNIEWPYTDFYSDGLRFATNTEFS